MIAWQKPASELWSSGMSTGRVLDALAERGFVVTEADFSKLRRRFPEEFPTRSEEQRGRNISAANTGKRRL